ncbi:MAG: hypothetical protein KF794_09825 [Xanthobacteraceae bacterium]|nr:hypothetical protein [Xanthobacteraceae bacterium]QYK44091.1 MAG: hypothetical protein KF794_09825 [Xanthobacteraceae bacterium]
MDEYLAEVAARIRRLSRATLDISTARSLRLLAGEVSERAKESDGTFHATGNGNGNHRGM